MRRLLLFCFCISLLSLAVHPLPAQTPEWALYTSTSDIRDIAQEGDALWLATSTGLVQIDRHTGAEKAFYHKTNSGLPSAQTTAVAVDHNGTKWIGSDRGIIRYDNSSWEVFSAANAPFTSNRILDITVDRNNTVWASTRNEVLYFSGDGWHIYENELLTDIVVIREAPAGFMVFGQACLKSSLECGTAYRSQDLSVPTTEQIWGYYLLHRTNVVGIAPVGDYIWFASNYDSYPNYPTSRLVRYRSSDTVVITSKDFGIGDDPICKLTALSADSSGRLWIADAMSRKIVVLDGDKRRVIDSSEFPAAAYNQVNTIITDSDGTVWIGTKLRGLLRYRGTTWSQYPFFGLHPSFADPNLSVEALSVDTNQSIWIGHLFAKEIKQFTGNEQVQLHALPYGLKEMKMDSKGAMWMMTVGPHNEVYSRAAGDTAWTDMNCPTPYALFIDKNDGVWVSSSIGVSKFDSKGRTDYTEQNSGLQGTCYAITQGRDGMIWMTTDKKLTRFNKGLWTHFDYPRPQAIHENLVCDSTGSLWMSSRFSASPAIVRFDGAQWTTFDKLDDTTSIQDAFDMLVDREGTVWAATCKDLDLLSFQSLALTNVPGGLVRYKNGKLDVLTSDNSPLISNGISALAVDKFNTLWIGTVSGLQAYREGGITTSAPEPAVASGNNALRNYPNPASALTTISYSVPGEAAQLVHIALYNSLGVQVAQLVHSVQPAGDHSVEFDTGTLPPGMYYCQLHTGSTTAGRQIVVVR